ncbi:MAG: hypothetical protein RIQ81_422 [Pseudomonadota bacterium]|jgi:hypothetical protein
MKAQTGDFVEGLRNRKTQKLFICLEAADSPGSVRVINPGGDILVVREELFDLEAVEVAIPALPEFFTPEQVSTWQEYQASEEDRRKAEAERRRWEEQERIRQQSAPATTPARTSPSRDSSPRRRTQGTPVKVIPGRVVAEWAGERLVFYRHKIEPLRPADQFQVKIHGVGVFQITKADFLRVFNNVIMSPQYRSQGMFSYETLPDEARPFLRS